MRALLLERVQSLDHRAIGFQFRIAYAGHFDDGGGIGARVGGKQEGEELAFHGAKSGQAKGNGTSDLLPRK
ncbi:hypothetical protein GCM10007388_17100 [Pseudoduganella plicata]|uniref:Uncharacterized protein n=1 Tax=Pseudoduganella plicata TaxID=321984 RepID=A0AA87Y202_9BURK|nr:hypothetical protein GCM10007388_17100 [Pseudoduganella plicata]